MQNLSGGTRFKCYPGPFSSVSYSKYGNKLLFSRKELLTWAENLAKRVNDKDEAALAIAKSANRKIRNYGK